MLGASLSYLQICEEEIKDIFFLVNCYRFCILLKTDGVIAEKRDFSSMNSAFDRKRLEKHL